MTNFLIRFVVLLMIAAPVSAGSYDEREELAGFIQKMVSEHAFDRDRLRKLFRNVQHKPKIIAAITRPAEGKPWHEYRKIFLVEKRISNGVKFWNDNANALSKAERTYGVPAEIITAIIGVETLYGTYTGGYKVIDALATLGFDYPPRSKFFSSELEQYLLLTREEGVDPLLLEGSYAGAMGMPQFISSSYRNYAIDFDDDGKRDIWGNTTDAIGSVANYFTRHGWRAGESVAHPVSVTGEEWKPFLSKHGKPKQTVAQLMFAGVDIPRGVDTSSRSALLEFAQPTDHDYLLAMNNFYVITRYNHSKLYARAVWELSQAIKKRRAASQL